MAQHDNDIHHQLGQLKATLDIVHKNTEQIPGIVTRVALAESAITDMKPKVDRHDNTHQRAIGASLLSSALFTTILALLGIHKG